MSQINVQKISLFTLSVGKVAGLESPALFDLLVVSINSGTNLLLGLGVPSGGGLIEIDTGVGSGVGKALAACFLLLKVVSIGSTRNLRFAATSFRSTPTSSVFCTSSFLPLRVVFSTGSTGNRRTFVTVVSTGVGVNRLEVGGGDVSGILVPALELMMRIESCAPFSIGVFVNNLTHSSGKEGRACDQKYGVLPRCSCVQLSPGTDANEMRPATAQRLAGIFPTGTVAETTCQLNAWPQVIQYGLCGENTYVRKVFGDSKRI